MKLVQFLAFVGAVVALPRGAQPGGPITCPFNLNHKPAAAWNPAFPYNHAKNGLPGKGQGGYQVPAVGDNEHRFIAPTEKDIRGPCPGLNALANHGFIARDGITDHKELLDTLQNVYNVGYDSANFLAFYAIYVAGLGDPVRKKLSIGCEATTRTSWAHLINNTVTFFGTQKLPDGSYVRVPEHIPSNWVNRKTPYFLPDIAAQILKMYSLNPVGFGGNAGGQFVGIKELPLINEGVLNANTTAADVSCLLYQILSRPIPSTLNGVVTPLVESVEGFLISIFGEEFNNLACPLGVHVCLSRRAIADDDDMFGSGIHVDLTDNHLQLKATLSP